MPKGWTIVQHQPKHGIWGPGREPQSVRDAYDARVQAQADARAEARAEARADEPEADRQAELQIS